MATAAGTQPFTPTTAQPVQTQRIVRTTATYVFLTVLAALWLIPIFAALITAVRTMDDI